MMTEAISNTMFERIERAVKQARSDWYRLRPDRDTNLDAWIAKAAIEAMRNPSKDMVTQGIRARSNGLSTDATYEVMIVTALEGK